MNKRKGEEYQLIWKDQPDFVRMAAKLNALVIPFAAVGGAPLACIDDLRALRLGQDSIAALRVCPGPCMNPAVTNVSNNRHSSPLRCALMAGVLCPVSLCMGHAVNATSSLP